MARTPQLPDGALLTNGPGDLAQLRLTTRSCSAIISPYGGQVLGWTPADTTPVLWLSPKAQYAQGTAVRGGIPVCAPWFGPGLDGQHKPAHGWMRTATWDLADVSTEDDAVVAVLTLDGRTVEGGGPVSARLRVSAATTLDVELTLTAHEAQTVEAALHTYLAVDDVRTVAVDGLQGVVWQDNGSGATGRDDAPVTFTGEVDRIYATSAPCSVLDPGRGRRIVVDKRGSGATVVWNPGAEKGESMKDIAVGWTQFVCVEAANAKLAAVELAAGESMTLGTTLSVADL